MLSFLSHSLPELTNIVRCDCVALLFQEPWLICLMAFHVVLLLTAVGFRRNANFQLFLLFLACESFVPSVITNHALHMPSTSLLRERVYDYVRIPQQELPDADKFVVSSFVRTICNPGRRALPRPRGRGRGRRVRLLAFLLAVLAALLAAVPGPGRRRRRDGVVPVAVPGAGLARAVPAATVLAIPALRAGAIATAVVLPLPAFPRSGLESFNKKS